MIARGSRFAHSANPRKEERMRDAPALERLRQRARDGLLAD